MNGSKKGGTHESENLGEVEADGDVDRPQHVHDGTRVPVVALQQSGQQLVLKIGWVCKERVFFNGELIFLCLCKCICLCVCIDRG